jgi:alanyl-tRNA synthetase
MIETMRDYYEYSGGENYAAEIVEIRSRTGDGKTALILDRTIFYPEGGGQPGDRGTINGVPLADVREEGGEILHMVDGGARFAPGPAELRLDTRRRRDFTVCHTAQHLLSGTILRLTGRPTVSMHLGDEICTIDVDAREKQGPMGSELSGEVLDAIEDSTADAVEANHPIIIHFCPPEDVTSFPLRKIPPQGEKVIRVVEIAGNDFSPCCGTHVRSTGEIGMLRILGAEKYKGMTRVTFIAGRRCLYDSRSLRHGAGVISRALKIPVAETSAGVLEYMEKTAATEKRLKELEEEAAGIKAQILVKTAAADKVPVLAESYPQIGMEEVLRIGRAAQKLTGAVIVLSSEKDLKFAAFCGEKGADVRPLVKDRLEVAGGKGGGGPSFFQGSFPSAAALAGFMKAFSNCSVAVCQ